MYYSENGNFLKIFSNKNQKSTPLCQRINPKFIRAQS